MRKTPARVVALFLLTSTSLAFAQDAATDAPATEKVPPADGPAPPAAPEEPPHPAEGSGGPAGPGASGALDAPAGPSPPPASAVVAEGEGTIPPARDTVGGHLAIGALAGFAVPFGSIDSKVAQSDVLGGGLVLGGDVTYGVSRTVMVGAYGEFGKPADAGAWSGRAVSSIAAGLMVRYHLVQGTRFDPWMSYGAGFRRLTAGTDSFTGLDWARIQLGGDWYATSGFGFGPWLQMSMGTYLGSSGSLDSKSVNAEFALGLRVVFDAPGK